MKIKKIISVLLSITVIFSVILPISMTSVPAAAESALVPAFPGAEGGGMYATGGRGGSIYHVTNLNDSGSGSFRDAVSGSNRIVVFDVGGTVELKSDVVVKSNITILGQTAPGGAGITFTGGKIGQGGSNQIIRFVSSRPGEKGSGEYDAWGGNDGSNSIVDHCSIGWANDEQWGLYSNNMNQTVQYSIVGPSNCISTHAKGAHGFGIMFGKGQNSWHHNMVVSNISRNYRGKVEKTNGMDFVNNVVFNWGYQTAYGTHGRINFVGNYYKAGQSTRGGYKFINISSGTAPENYRFYMTGNKIVNPDGSDYSTEINENNWNGGINYGGAGLGESDYRVDSPVPVLDVNGNDVSVAANAQTADEAFETVLAYAGAGIDAQSRPKIDREVMEEARTGNGYLTGGRDFASVTDSAQLEAIKTYDIKQVNYDDYYPATVQKTITDSDGDGMPDDWELERGLDPNNASDASDDYLGQGYMNIEYYANDLTVNAFPEGVVQVSPTTNDLGPEYTNAKDDLNAITLSPTTIKAVGELTLPQTGTINGTPITWKSSSTAIKISGNQISAVNRADADKTVTLTATASVTVDNKIHTINKSFNITVIGSSSFWKASANVTAGTELIDGLTAQFNGTYKAASVTTDDISFTGYLSSDAGSGSFAGGVATGTSFKFIAPTDGYITAYVTNLGSAPSETSAGTLRTMYITPEGAENSEACVASVSGRGISTCCTAAVESGKTYYIYVAGSSGRFNGIRFSENPIATPIAANPGIWDFSNEPFIIDGIPNQIYFPEGATEGRYDLETNSIMPEIFNGLTFTVDESIGNAYTKSVKTFEGGFESAWQIKTNGGGSAENKVFTFFPSEDGTITVYARSGSGSNASTLTIAQGGVTKTLELVGFNSEPEGDLPTLSMDITAGTEVRIYASGNTGYSAIGYYNENYVAPTPDPNKPTATPKPTEIPAYPGTWNFSDEPFTVTDGDSIHPNTQYFPAGTSEGRYDVPNNAVTAENFGGLTYKTSTTSANGWLSTPKTFTDGFEGNWQLKTNGAGSTSDRVFTFYPIADGEVTVYARSGSSGNPATLTIAQGSTTNTLELTATNNEDTAYPDGKLPILSLEVTAGTAVKIYSSSNTGFYGIKYDADYAKPTADPNKPTAAPTATPAPATMPPVLESWDFENIEAGTSYSAGDTIANTNGKPLTVGFASAGGKNPVIESSADGNYIKFTDNGAGQDGWAYEPDNPLNDDKVIVSFDFNMAADSKDAILVRAYDSNNQAASNTYTSDDRVFEIKTNGTGGLVFTDYFSKGSSDTKGQDTTISGFSYSPNTWYSLKLEYTKSDSKVKVYAKQGSAAYKQIGAYTLASGETTKVNGKAPALALTKIQAFTPGSGTLTISVDNIAIGTQTNALMPVNPTPTPDNTPVYAFIQNGNVVDNFADGELTFNIKDGALSQSILIIAGYDSNGALTSIEKTTVSSDTASVTITPDSSTETVRVFLWDSLETIQPMYSFFVEITRN